MNKKKISSILIATAFPFIIPLAASATSGPGWYKLATIDDRFMNQCEHVDGSEAETAVSMTKNLKNPKIDQTKDSSGKLNFISATGTNNLGQTITRLFYRDKSECLKKLNQSSVSHDDYK